MNTRIRYSREVDGSLISMKVIKSDVNNLEYRASIASDGKSGVVTNVLTGETKTVTGPSSHKVKIAVKAALESLGCTFNKETRILNKETT